MLSISQLEESRIEEVIGELSFLQKSNENEENENDLEFEQSMVSEMSGADALI